MCERCGCSSETETRLTDLQTGGHFHLGRDGREFWHNHADDHHHHHHAEHSIIPIEHELLAGNNRLAEQNRGWLDGRGVKAFNLMSSPGSGKTTLLEQTIRRLGAEQEILVIEGDQETVRDAERIRAAGAKAVQVNTGTACHLDARMVGAALRQLDPTPGSIVMVENVGNLVCPALFNLGENARIVVSSVTEGDDKPAKYPHIFRSANLIILNKIDLLPYVQFQPGLFEEAARALNPKVTILQTSATRGDGLAEWCQWLRQKHTNHAQPHAH